MKLSTYMDCFHLSQNAMAKKIGVTQAAISLYLSGRRMPSWAILQDIIKATDGKVMPNDFLPRE